MRERKKTDAADLANAVDDIDFFAGKEGLSKRDDLQFLNRSKGKTDASGNYINADGTPRRTSDYFPAATAAQARTACRATSLARARRWSNDPRNGKRLRGTIGRRAWVESVADENLRHTHARYTARLTRHDRRGASGRDGGRRDMLDRGSAHFLRRHSCAASSLCPPSWYDERTYWTSVASQRRWTLSQPTCSISDAVAHMQMHHEPGVRLGHDRAVPLPRLLVGELPEVAARAPRERRDVAWSTSWARTRAAVVVAFEVAVARPSPGQTSMPLASENMAMRRPCASG